MISLKTYLLRPSYQEMESSYCRMIDLLLQVTSVHAVEDDVAEHKRFRADMTALADRLGTKTNISDRSIVVGEALHTIEDYNRRTTNSIQTKTTELQKVAAMLTEAVIAVGEHDEACVVRLQQIDKSLNQALKVTDIRLLKSQLGECLEESATVGFDQERHQRTANELATIKSQQLDAGHIEVKDTPGGAEC